MEAYTKDDMLKYFSGNAPIDTYYAIAALPDQEYQDLFLRWRKTLLPALRSGEWASMDVEPKPSYIFGAAWTPEGWVIKELFEEYDEWLCVRSDRRYIPVFWVPASDENRFVVK